MHIIDINIMKLSSNYCNISDFKRVLSLCEKKDLGVDSAVVNGNKFYFPEKEYSCDLDKVPIVGRDPEAEIAPIICLASGNNYLLLKTTGSDFVLSQHTSLTALLLGLGESFSDIKILDAEFHDGYSVWLIVFNGNTGN